MNIGLSRLLPLIDTDPNAGPVDPLAALEKSTEAENRMKNVQIPRLEALQTVSDVYSSDPYSQSLRARKRFREEKKVIQEKEASDRTIKDVYALPETLALAEESDAAKAEAKEGWIKGRQEFNERAAAKRRRITAPIEIAPSRSSSTTSSLVSKASKLTSRATSVSSLRAKILENTARQRGSSSTSGFLKKPPDAVIKGIHR